MKELEYVKPKTIKETVTFLKAKGSKARPFAGATDLLVLLRAGRREAEYLVDVKGIPQLNELSYSPAKGLTIGAAVPCYRIYEEPKIAKVFPAINDSASIIGGIQIQSRASLGGNLCNAAPSADAIPSLIVHNAIAVIAGPKGTREVPVEDFCTGPGQNILKAGEFLVSIKVPTPPKNSGSMYMRFTPRNEMDIAVAGSGIFVQLSPNGKRIVSAKVALSAVAPTPLLVEKAATYLEGKTISDEVISKAGEIAKSAAKPITDMRGTIEQRKHLCDVLTRRALKGAIDRAKEAK